MNPLELDGYPVSAFEAAGYAGISLGHLYNLISARKGPRHVKYGGQLRFRKRDLDTWVARRCRTFDAEAD